MINGISKFFATTLLVASVSALAATPQLSPVLETRSHFNDKAGNFTDVDDPAIWIHPDDASRSLVVGTLKEGGLDVYDLSGHLIQHIPASSTCAESQLSCSENAPGRFNNADIIYGFPLGDEKADLIVISDRGRDTLVIYKVAQGAKDAIKLIDITAVKQAFIFSSSQDEVNQARTAYGLATAYTDKARAYVSQNNTPRIAVLELFDHGDGSVAYRNEETLEFPRKFPLDNGGRWTPCTDDDDDQPHFEGMVADHLHNRLYLGQENVGLWRVALNAPSDKSQWELFGKVSDFGVPYSRTWDEAEEEYLCELDANKDPGYGDPQLQADVEGLTLYRAKNGGGYLLASSQGNNTVAVYDRAGDNQYRGSFTVGAGKVDAVNETDGMMVINNQLPAPFSEGLVVMQDGENLNPQSNTGGPDRESSNFKYISWGDIAKQLDLIIDTDDRSRE